MSGAKSPIDAIAKLLHHEAPERRIAAAIVLGELGSKGPEVVKGLVAMLETGAPPLQRPALDALTRIASTKAVPAMLPLLASRAAEVRAAAIDAVVACGEGVVDIVRERLPSASGEERKALDAVLARFGDRKEAVTALLGNLEASDPEVARAVAVQIRPRIKEADAKTRRLWLTELRRILERMSKTPPPSPIPMATAVKILGYLEDPKATEELLAYAKNARAPFAVRQEALIALRYLVKDDERGGEVIDAMVEAAEGEDRMMAQAALMGLAAAELPPEHAARIARLALHADPERARVAIEKLKSQPGAEVTRALVDVIAKGDRRRGELAVAALRERADATGALVAALVAETDADRANTLRHALKPHAKSVTAAQRKKLVEAALERVREGEAWQAHVDVAREADGKALGEGLRELVAKLKRGKNEERLRSVLELLARSDLADGDERYLLASLGLRASPCDTLPAARRRDPALSMLDALSDRGFDVASALRKDRTLELEHLFYVGFHFAEEKHPLGEELLGEVVKKGGRTKLAKMARNKLGLS